MVTFNPSVLAAGAVCAMLVIAVPVVTTAARASSEPSMAVCQEPPSYISPEDIWYMRATAYLDCIDELADRRLISATGSPGGEDADTVEIPRAELERIRTLAVYARDAAARIGR